MYRDSHMSANRRRASAKARRQLDPWRRDWRRRAWRCGHSVPRAAAIALAQVSRAVTLWRAHAVARESASNVRFLAAEHHGKSSLSTSAVRDDERYELAGMRRSDPSPSAWMTREAQRCGAASRSPGPACQVRSAQSVESSAPWRLGTVPCASLAHVA